MKAWRRTGSWLAACAIATSAAAGDGLRPGESEQDVETAYPGSPFQETWAVRVVDAWTRRPIAGALVRVPNHVAGGATPEDIVDLAASRTDEAGWSRIPYAKIEGWRDYVVADAPGYAPDEYCTPGDDECALRPGTDVPVVLVDFTGRPVADAHVALNLGCGHIADQRAATTDANGLAVLHSIRPDRLGGPDLWIESPHLHRGTTGLTRTWRVGDPPVPIHMSPGIVVEGRIVGLDGAPVAGARVGVHEVDRPWVTSGDDGTFRLVGVAAWSRIDVLLEDVQREAWFWSPPEGVRRTFVLGAAADGVPVTVHARGPSGEAAEGVRIALVRRADGLTAPRRSDADGAAEFSLPPGVYDVLADGELGTWGRASTSIELTAGAPEPVRLDVAVPRNPTVRIDASRLSEVDVRVMLTTARQFREIAEDALDGADVPVPVDERATFRVSGWEDGELAVRWFEVPADAVSRPTSISLDWTASSRIRTRLVGPDGLPVAGTLTVTRDDPFAAPPSGLDPTTEPVAESRLVGTVSWIGESVGPGLFVARGTAVLPTSGGDVDLGEVRLAPLPWPTFVVELPPGLDRAATAVNAHALRTGYESAGEPARDGAFPFDPDAVADGDLVQFRLDDPAWLPLLHRVEGPPPWTVRWPSASLRLRVLDAAGEPVNLADLLVDGAPTGIDTDADGVAWVRGLSAGFHDVIVVDEAHLTRVLRLDVRDGESRELELRLTPRP